MNSTTSSVSSTKYDPDLLRSDVALARNRVARLKRELEQINMEMQYKQQGVDRLTRYAHSFFLKKFLGVVSMDFVGVTSASVKGNFTSGGLGEM